MGKIYRAPQPTGPESFTFRSSSDIDRCSIKLASWCPSLISIGSNTHFILAAALSASTAQLEQWQSLPSASFSPEVLVRVMESPIEWSKKVKIGIVYQARGNGLLQMLRSAKQDTEFAEHGFIHYKQMVTNERSAYRGAVRLQSTSSGRIRHK